jgi:Ser/Thr protein kinase RdoA (MazF antagonist)
LTVEEPLLCLINVQPEPEAVAAHVGDAYGLAGPITAKLLRRGFNDTFRIDATDGTRYAFRVYFHGKYYIDGPDDFRFELELLHFVAERGVPVARPLPLDRCAALFAWPDAAPPEERTTEQARVMGQALGRFHVAADAFSTALPRYCLDLTYLLDRPAREHAQLSATDRPGSQKSTALFRSRNPCERGCLRSR